MPHVNSRTPVRRRRVPIAAVAPVCATAPTSAICCWVPAAASLELLGCFVSSTSLWRDVQLRQAKAPWDTTAKLPGVVLLDETWLPLEGRKLPVDVVLDSEGQPRDLRRTGPDFDWTAYFPELEARGVQTLVADDNPTFRKALQGCGLDRQLCVGGCSACARARTRSCQPRRTRPCCRGWCGWVRELPLWGSQLLLVCCEWAHQDLVRLSPPALSLVEHVMDRWNDLVRCVRNPATPPARTGWRTGLTASSPGRGGPAA
ncbi:MAG: hypothetical protein F4Y08_00045 [Caldilineaceae bacterium SB0662_bin_9]|uniref:Transposase n=1 Tax=Caldilineaceae bacterium SB0662_bin_9 TaxID=2605258 RepID=A0A6B1DPG8_9CHLR|nr:hypothetical protein [Caldilineaceae bacterium SB0662_bin_9]